MGEDQVRCKNCGSDGADVHTLLCPPCLISLPPYFRHKEEIEAISAAMIRQALVDGENVAIRWTEQQYQDHLRKVQQPPKPEDRKAKARKPPKHDPRTLIFELPLTPSRNEWDRTHYHVKKRKMTEIANAIMAQIPLASGVPFRSAKVEIVRQTSVQPDPDGLTGSVKPILDALQVRSKRHPYGAGVIDDDSSDHIQLKVRWEKVPPKQGKVLVMVTPR